MNQKKAKALRKLMEGTPKMIRVMKGQRKRFVNHYRNAKRLYNPNKGLKQAQKDADIKAVVLEFYKVYKLV